MPERRGFLLELISTAENDVHQLSTGKATPIEGVPMVGQFSRRTIQTRRLLICCREIPLGTERQNGLTEAEAGHYIQVIGAYLAGFEMIIATRGHHGSIISA